MWNGTRISADCQFLGCERSAMPKQPLTHLLIQAHSDLQTEGSYQNEFLENEDFRARMSLSTEGA